MLGMVNMEETRAVGRPRTKTSDLPEGWKQMMRDCGQQVGRVVAEFA